MTAAKYAAFGSTGRNWDKIAWINFEDAGLKITDEVKVTNVLKDGTIVSFNVSSTSQGNSGFDIRDQIAGVPFTNSYKSLGGKTVLEDGDASGNGSTLIFNSIDIQPTDGLIIKNYTLYVADAGQTLGVKQDNKGPEYWRFTSSNSNWSLFDTLPAVGSSVGASPSITTLPSNIVTETGVETDTSKNVAAYVFASDNVESITAEAVSIGNNSKQAMALGISIEYETKINCGLQVALCSENIAVYVCKGARQCFNFTGLNCCCGSNISISGILPTDSRFGTFTLNESGVCFDPATTLGNERVPTSVSANFTATTTDLCGVTDAVTFTVNFVYDSCRCGRRNCTRCHNNCK